MSLSTGRTTAIVYAIIISHLFFLVACNSDTSTEPLYAKGTREGYELAKNHCTSCHSFVPATALDKKTWKKHVLPSMATRLGIKVLWNSEYVATSNNGSSSVRMEEWQKILDYYLRSSPDTIIIPEPLKPIIKDSAIFSVHQPSYRLQSDARTVLVSIDTNTHCFYTSDFNSTLLYKWNSQLDLIDSLKLQSPILYANYYTGTDKKPYAYFTEVGFMRPSNDKLGRVISFPLSGRLDSRADTIAKQLARPVFSAAGDLNNDGLTDLAICEFGYVEFGGLYTLTQLPNGSYEKATLVKSPGATQAIIRDFDNDGWNDIIALFAHDRESIRLYINNKKGGFSEKIIMNFPPVNGSSSIQIADFNKDGIDDILYSSGDNADISMILKPFHGIYIFLGKGNFKYEQSYFYQINGCTKAVAADFDNDGDLDIATIAFYADFNNRPEEGFLYFEQKARMEFDVHSPQLNKYGRWMTMDVNDYDGDGDHDIILGNFPREIDRPQKKTSTWDEHLPFIVLENKTK